VLERIDFGSNHGIAEWCEHLASQHVTFNADEAGRTAREMVERFTASERACQLASAAAVHREIEFLLGWPLHGVDGAGAPPSSQTSFDWGLAGDQSQPTERFIQGYIDCLYQDRDGAWHLLDYKTQVIKSRDAGRAAACYELQMYVYAIAAERALGAPPIELVLHFLQPGVEYVFNWNDSARRRAIDMVNEALAKVAQAQSSSLIAESTI
jgi:ATP-dependent exoDNAse (exonuclease V) beta subunit